MVIALEARNNIYNSIYNPIAKIILFFSTSGKGGFIFAELGAGPISTS